MTAPAVVRSTTRRHHDNSVGVLVDLMADLTAQLAATDRSQRLVDVLQRALPCDSAALLRLEGEILVPFAAYGLVPELMSQRFVVAEHPRFAQILRRREPVRFVDSTLQSRGIPQERSLRVFWQFSWGCRAKPRPAA